jgi:hypothetical protein
MGFPDLSNTRTISAATLTLHYWNELDGPPQTSLSTDVLQADEQILVSGGPAVPVGSIIQVEAELMRIEQELPAGSGYRVTRGYHDSEAAPHAVSSTVYGLSQKVHIMPFPREFFGTPVSGGWTHTVVVPDARIGAAELYVTNSMGSSDATAACLTGTADFGLRTLSGGQLTFQIDGFLAIENGAAPDMYVEATHAVRDIFATVRHAPLGSDLQLRLMMDAVEYCTLTFSPGTTTSDVKNGLSLPPLRAGSTLRLDVLAVGIDAPGSDLNVIIRL